MLAKGLNGLISQVTQTSNLDAMFIYRLWDGYIDELRWTLIKSYWLQGNPWEISDEEACNGFGMILAKACSYYGVTFKATGGFYLKQATNTIMSIYNPAQRMDGNVMPQKPGLRDRLRGQMGGGQQ